MATIRGPRIVRSGLVLALDAADRKSYSGSGTAWNDLSGNNNNGTLTNGPTFSSANGGNFSFNGTTQYVNCGDNTSLRITQGTISAWVKSTTNDTEFRAILVKQGNYGLFIRNSYLITYDWGNDVTRESTTNIIDGNWKNVVQTFTTNTGAPSNNTTLYVNGVSILITTTKFLLHERNFLVGYGNAGNQYLNGSIANGLVYNRALSASEILQNFNATRGRFGI